MFTSTAFPIYRGTLLAGPRISAVQCPSNHFYRIASSRPFCFIRGSRSFTHGSTNATEVTKDGEQGRKWPRGTPDEYEAITPPSSTSVASTSNAPLLKDLFRGQLHLELLEFPELKNQKEVGRMNELHKHIQHFILRLDSEGMDQTGRVPSTFVSEVRNQGLFGLHVGADFGGQGLTHFQTARAWEAIGIDLSIFTILDMHSSVCQAIKIAGTEEQQRYYLPKLATGEHVGTLCVTEISSGNDLNAISTEAISTENGQTYIINGKKSWITNGASASLFVVLARLPELNKSNPSGSNITAFLVDRSTPGVSSGMRMDVLGLRASEFTDVTFQNVHVPATNMLGTPGCGTQLIQTVADRGFLNLCASFTGLLRYLITYATEHCLRRHQFGRPIGDYSLVQAMLADLALNVYVMESGVFYLAGLWDAQPNRDLGLEISALKIFCSEALWAGINNCMQLTGRVGLEQGTPFARYFRDCRSMLSYGGTNEVVRLRLAGAGLQHISNEVDAQHAKLFVMARHPWLTMKTILRMRGRKLGWYANKVGAGPKVTEGKASQALKDHLHPNFAKSATQLAIVLQRFQSLVEALLIEYGQSVVDEQIALGRVADCTVDLLLSAICLGRASRAISIGLPLHDYEVRLANTFVKMACKRIQANLLAPRELDGELHRISSELLSHGTYPVTHPLSRVW